MKNRLLGLLPFLLFILGLTGCQSAGNKTTSLSIIYGAAAILSLALLVACLVLVRKNRAWFILLFSSVLVVNVGYTLLSVSPDLTTALWANRLSYLGSVFLPLSMLMIILSVTATKYKKWLPISLLVLAFLMFLIAASPGILDLYYKNVSFEIVHGVSTLVKEYGPLHPLYLIYLLGYFSAMVAVIIQAAVKRTIDTVSHAVFIAMAVFVNIGVWGIEQLSSIEFEFLSVSYIISELFLVGVHLVMKEHQRLKELLAKKDQALLEFHDKQSPAPAGHVSPKAITCFAGGLPTLTPTERAIYDAYLAGSTTKEIMSDLGIKENTLKFHNKNLYGKLGVSSRKQLLEVAKAMETQACH